MCAYRRLHTTRIAREEKAADPKNIKTKEMLAYEAKQRGEITTARKGSNEMHCMRVVFIPLCISSVAA